jgi:membrane fusion protein (multidrug efflux system)
MHFSNTSRSLFQKTTPPAITPNSRRILSLAVLSLPLLLAACGKPDGEGKPGMGEMPAPEVNVVTVQARNLPIDFEYVGQTAGSRETEVRARISGILQDRLYEEGARVKAGALLFQIDPGTYQTQLASVEAAAGVVEARLNQAKREFARLTPLAAEKAISQKEFDDAQSNLESAEASFKQARAQANEARLNLGYTKVVAPIAGVTGIAAKSNGSLVTPADSLLTTIVQTDPLYINFSISEADFLKMNSEISNGTLALAGKRASNGSLAFAIKLKLADGSIFPATGKMNFVSERVNVATGGFDARAQIANPDGVLRPGQFVRVNLGGATRSGAIAVPQRAVIDGPMGKMVFTVSAENKLVPKPVELNGWSNGEWIVTKGLQSGERVLVDGFIKAHTPGMLVKPVALAATAATSANEGSGKTAPPSAPKAGSSAAHSVAKSATQ